MSHDEQNIFSWKEWDDSDHLENIFYNVEFLRDFGSFKKGDKFEAITVNYDKCYIFEHENRIKVEYKWEPKDVHQTRPQ